MSSHRSRIAPSKIGSGLTMGMGVPSAPPPPSLSSHRPGSSGRSSSRRSRSRSPTTRISRFSHESRERSEYDGNRRKSPSPSYRSVPGSSTSSFRGNSSTGLHTSLQDHSHSLIQSQSISLITGDSSRPIIRRILNPELVSIPRRPGEGVREIFDREELKDAMLRRMRSDNNDDNPTHATTMIPHTQQQQRVIAIIREPANLPLDNYRMPVKESTIASNMPRHSHLRESSPLHSPRPVSNSYSSRDRDTRERRSISPAPTRDRDRSQRTLNERPTTDRKRDLLYEIRDRDKQSELQQERSSRESRDHIAVKTRAIRSRSKDRLAAVERGRPYDIPPASRPRSRSPVRILRERIERRSRSRSVTPPPMPEHVRRQMLERERDLRSKLSRPIGKFPNKFDPEHDSGTFRGSSRGFNRGGGSGSNRGRGGFSRGGRSRGGPWQHDMFDRDSVDETVRDLVK